MNQEETTRKHEDHTQIRDRSVRRDEAWVTHQSQLTIDESLQTKCNDR